MDYRWLFGLMRAKTFFIWLQLIVILIVMLQAMLYGTSVGNSCPVSSSRPLLLLNVSGVSDGLQLMQDGLTVVNVPAAVASTNARFVMLASTLLLVFSCVSGLLGLRWALDLHDAKAGCCSAYRCSPLILVTFSLITQVGFLLQMVLWSGATVYLELERLFSRGYRSARLGQFLTFTVVPLLVFWTLIAYLVRGYRCFWRYIRFLHMQTDLGRSGSSLVRLTGEVASGEQELNGTYGQMKQRVRNDASRLISPTKISPEARIEMLKPRVRTSTKATASRLPTDEPGGNADFYTHSYVNQPLYENQLPSDVSTDSPNNAESSGSRGGRRSRIKGKLSTFRSSRSILMPIDTIQKVFNLCDVPNGNKVTARAHISPKGSNHAHSASKATSKSNVVVAPTYVGRLSAKVRPGRCTARNVFEERERGYY